CVSGFVSVWYWLLNLSLFSFRRNGVCWYIFVIHIFILTQGAEIQKSQIHWSSYFLFPAGRLSSTLRSNPFFHMNPFLHKSPHDAYIHHLHTHDSLYIQNKQGHPAVVALCLLRKTLYIFRWCRANLHLFVRAC